MCSGYKLAINFNSDLTEQGCCGDGVVVRTLLFFWRTRVWFLTQVEQITTSSSRGSDNLVLTFVGMYTHKDTCTHLHTYAHTGFHF